MEQTITGAVEILSPEDSAGIERAVLDYVEGWYEADPARMAIMMVEYTGSGGGSDVPAAEREYEIIIQDAFRHMAVVKAISPLYVDYCQLLRFEEGWQIVNVLWEVREGEVEAEA
jgi:hypothetical protein